MSAEASGIETTALMRSDPDEAFRAMMSAAPVVGSSAMSAVDGVVTSRRRNAHRIEEREVLYRFHPWAGCVVHVHEAIERASGDMVRCSRDGDASGRWLELPVWMLDRASCTLIELVAAPRVDLAAVGALIELLQATKRTDCRIIECPAFGCSNGASRPESGRGPCDDRRAPITILTANRGSSICSRRRAPAAWTRRRNGAAFPPMRAER